MVVATQPRRQAAVPKIKGPKTVAKNDGHFESIQKRKKHADRLSSKDNGVVHVKNSAVCIGTVKADSVNVQISRIMDCKFAMVNVKVPVRLASRQVNVWHPRPLSRVTWIPTR